jgi:hypothetical protein
MKSINASPVAGCLCKRCVNLRAAPAVLNHPDNEQLPPVIGERYRDVLEQRARIHLEN